MASAAEGVEPVHLPKPVVWVRRWTWRLVGASAGMGALGAFAAAVVRLGFRGLEWVLTGSGANLPVAADGLALPRRALTPVGGAVLAGLVVFLAKRRARRLRQAPRPYTEYVEAVRHRGGRIPLGPNAWRTVGAAFSVASGAAVGREGSMIQLAASVVSRVGRWWGWMEGKDGEAGLSFLLACGVAGGVVTAYNAPVAAIFFAAEIVLGGLAWRELPLLGLASGMGWLVSGTMLGWARLYPAHAALGWGWSLWLLPLLAVLCGLVGPAYQWLLGSLRRLRELPGALVWSGVVVGCLSVLDPRVWGNGDAGLSAALGRADLPGLGLGAGSLGRVLGLRLAATLACVWTGTVGGAFTPTLFAGGAMGSLLGRLAPGGASVLWAIAGMSFLMAAVTHAPWMAGFMAAELTGDWALLPVLLPLNFLAYWMARRISPQAMYAIASQSPEGGRRKGEGALEKVE